RCSMACTWLTRMARSVGSARMERSSLAPSVRLVESSAKSSKNLVSRGIRRMGICAQVTGRFRCKRLAKSRVISHAQWAGGKRAGLARVLVGDQQRGPAGGAQPNQPQYQEDCDGSQGYSVKESEKDLTKIHAWIMGGGTRPCDITDRLILRCAVWLLPSYDYRGKTGNSAQFSLCVWPLRFGEQCAVDPDGLPADERGCRAGEKNHGGRDVGGRAHTAQGRELRPGSGVVGIFLAGARRFDGAGRDAIYPDAIRSQFDCRFFGEHLDAAFAGGIRDQRRKCEFVAARPEIYDRAAAVVFHEARGLLS